MPRWKAGKKQKSGTNNATKAAAKAASDAAVARGEPNPNPVGRPPLMQGAEVVPSTPVGLPRGSERRGAAIAAGEDAGLIPIWQLPKRRRLAQGAYADDPAADISPLTYVSVSEGEVRTAIKVAYVKTLKAPPESEWTGSDGTINTIIHDLVPGVGYGTVHDVLIRIKGAEENKMDIDVGKQCFPKGRPR